MSHLGDQIYELRKKEGLSQEEFAYRIRCIKANSISLGKW